MLQKGKDEQYLSELVGFRLNILYLLTLSACVILIVACVLKNELVLKMN